MTYITHRVVASGAALMGNRYKHFIIPLMNGKVGRWKRIEVSIRMIANRFYGDLKADNVHRIPRYNELRQIIFNYTAFVSHTRKIKKKDGIFLFRHLSRYFFRTRLCLCSRSTDIKIPGNFFNRTKRKIKWKYPWLGRLQERNEL